MRVARLAHYASVMTHVTVSSPSANPCPITKLPVVVEATWTPRTHNPPVLHEATAPAPPGSPHPQDTCAVAVTSACATVVDTPGESVTETTVPSTPDPVDAQTNSCRSLSYFSRHPLDTFR